MEIIHVVLGKANPNRMNGVNKVVYQLASRQALSGSDVSVWGISSNTEINFDERNFKTRLFLNHKNPFGINTLLQKALVEKKGKAVFHIHGGWIPVFSRIARLLKKHNIPFIFTPHGAYNTLAMQRNSLVKAIYFRVFEKSLLNRASKIHCIGQSEVSGLKNIYKTNKTVLLPYGFEGSVSEGKGSDAKSKMIIGFVGRLDIHTKGLDLLLAAYELFRKEVPESEVWIIGDSEEKVKLHHMISQKQLQANVKLLGSKFGKEKDALLMQMDVFVHPSRNEGLPASVLEAANCGIPCIVSEATNLSQYVELFDAGISIADENVAELKEAFLKIYALKQNNKIADMKLNAATMVNKAFNWTQLLKEYYRIYSFAANTAL